MGIYVTDTGFVKKTLSQIKTELENEFQAVFGNTIDLSSSGGFGQIIGISAKYAAEAWDAAEEIYTCRNPNQASGICLDNIAAENNIIRKAATATTVDRVLLGADNGTTINAGSKARQVNSSINYSLVSSVTVSKVEATKGVISVTNVASGTYRVTLDTVNYDYVATGTESKTAILTAISGLITAGTWTGTSTVENEQLILIDFTIIFSFDVTGNLNIDEIHKQGEFICDVVGANSLPANTLVEIVTPETGWNSIININAGITGQETETDQEFRNRRAQSLITGTATEEAIASAVLNNIADVVTTNIVSNRTDATDGDSRPPHSFELVVEGGDDYAIANEIWLTQPAGIASYGNTLVYIIDSKGITQEINFSRPEIVYIFLKVKRSLYTEEQYPSDGDDLIKQNIINWSLDRTNIDIGIDVILQRLITPIYGVPNTTYPTIPGIKDIQITVDSSTTLPHTPTYTSSNVSIGYRQYAVFAIDRIVVEAL